MDTCLSVCRGIVRCACCSNCAVKQQHGGVQDQEIDEPSGLDKYIFEAGEKMGHQSSLLSDLNTTIERSNWRFICKVPESEERDLSLDDWTPDVSHPQQVLPANLQLVEQLSSLDFQPSRHMK